MNYQSSMLERLLLLFDKVTSNYMRKRVGGFDLKSAGLYRSDFRWSTGNKYVLLSHRNHAFGFVVMRDDGQLRRGDLIGSSGGNPSRRHIYGNIFEDFSVKWVRI